MIRKDKIKKYDVLLQKYIDNKSFVKFFRTIFDKEENLSGFILSISKSFLLIQRDYDFLLDGFAIIRKDDFDSIRHSSYERTQRKIFNEEGLLSEGYGFDRKIKLDNWAEIIKTLKNYGFHLIIQNTNNGHLDFWIGEVTKVTDKTVSIHNYNPDGILDEKSTTIKLETIRTITW